MYSRKIAGAYRATLALAGLFCAFMVGEVTAAPTTQPDGAVLLEQMRLTVVPVKAQIGRGTLVMREASGASRSWHMQVARKRFSDGPRTVLGFTAPLDIRGTALLTAPRQSGEGYGLWLYQPSERRSRELSGIDAAHAFLGTDFDYADLGMTPDPVTAIAVTGKVEQDGVTAYVVESRPADKSEWQYLRTVTWVAADTHLPLKREAYDRANRLWKVAVFHHTVIDGIATLTDIVMTNVQTRSTTEWRLDEVRYDQAVDDDIFAVKGLATVVDNPLWAPSVAAVTSVAP